MVGHEYSEHDPYYADQKSAKKFYEKLCLVQEVYGRPNYCVGCGKGMKKQITEKGEHFYICTDYEDDGTHVRISAINAFADELDVLRFQVDQMRKEIDELKALVKGSGSGSRGSC